MPISNYVPTSAIARPGVCTSTTRPASPYEGQVIYETDTDKILVWRGAAWDPPWNTAWGIVDTTSGGTSGKGYAVATGGDVTVTTSITDVYSFTFNAVANRVYSFTFSATTTKLTADGYIVAYIRDGSNNVLGQWVWHVLNGKYFLSAGTCLYKATSTGSFTLKLSGLAENNTARFFANSPYSLQVKLEDVGPA